MSDEITERNKTVANFPAVIEMAEHFKLPTLAFVITFREVAMPVPHTDAEFVSCLLVAREHGLNPLTKEIYFMRTKEGKIEPIVGVDGWIRKANEHPQFDGMECKENLDAQGKIVSITTTIWRKDRTRPTVATEYMAECVQTRSKPGPWQSVPSRMLRHRSICQGVRIAIGFAGVITPEEFESWQDGLKNVTPKPTRIVEDIPEAIAAPAAALELPEDAREVEEVPA